MKTIPWETIESSDTSPDITRRAKVPGGWLVSVHWEPGGGGLTFVPDPNHTWDLSNSK